MEFESFDQFVLTLSSVELDELKEILELVEDIKKNSPEAFSTVDFHPFLREKYFLLVQRIIEKPHDLITKFTFNLVQNFLLLESKCGLCSYKEKCQFLLNVLRYIQHNIINSDIFKLELLRFLMNNNQTIEAFLNSKILTCVLEISFNEADSDNKIVESTCKAVAIKYTALVCNQISSYKHEENDSVTSSTEDFDSYLVNVFAYLLKAFKQENRSSISKSLSLECIELLLNNLINESFSASTKCYDLKQNEMFIEFAWQTFCPSILFQFGELGLTESNMTNQASTRSHQTVYFRQIYSILIQLTALIGGCKSMIAVFEAVFQRILTYPPENDRAHILKLFKNYLTEKFVESICFNESNSNHSPLKADFTLMNLIVGFFRNCYELAVKEPEDRILQLLSCECLSVFVQIVYNLFLKTQSSISQVGAHKDVFNVEFESIFMSNQKELEKLIDTNVKQELRAEAESFISHLSKCFSNDVSENISRQANCFDLRIKLFALEFVQDGTSWKELSKLIRSNPDRIYSATNFCFYVLFKQKLNEVLGLSENNLFECENQAHRNFFIHRVLLYDQLGSVFDSSDTARFILWLTFVYKELFTNSSIPDAIEAIQSDANLFQQIKIVIKQMDTFTKLNTELTVTQMHETMLEETGRIEQIRRLLKCLWTYFVDVFVGFLTQANLTLFEKCLNTTVNCNNTNASLTDFSFTLFALKSCLDSVFKLIELVSWLGQMDKELSQIFFLLRVNWLKEGSFNLDRPVSLNQFICLDFLLYVCTQLVCDLNRVESNSYRISKSTRDLVWKCLAECSMIAAYLNANIETLSVEKTSKHLKDGLDLTSGFFSSRSFLNKRENLFKSVYSNLNELAGNEWENALKIIRRKSSTWSLGSNVDNVNDDQSTHGHSDINSAEFQVQQREIIMKSSFLFLTKLKSNKHESIQEILVPLGSQDHYNSLKKLVEGLIWNIDQFFYSHLIDSTINSNASFDFLWMYSSNLCNLSERFLLNEPSIRLKHEYFSINSLIIDKIDELLVQLVTKLAVNEEQYASNLIGLDISPSLIPQSTNQVHLPNPCSLYAIFLSELWLNVFNVYFNSVFTKFAAVQTRFHSTTTSTTMNSDRTESEDEMEKKLEPLVDLAMCKKLVLLIKKAFETYNRHMMTNLNYLQSRTNQNWSQQIKDPTLNECFPSIVSDEISDSSVIDIESMVKKLDQVRESIKKRSNWTTSMLLNDATASLLKSESKPNAVQIQACLIDESFNMNRLFLLPYKQLMSNERLDSHLKDAVIVSLCELVENSSGRCMKNSWKHLFDCLVDLNLDYKRGKRKNGKSKRIISRCKDKLTKDSSESSLASSSSSDDDEHQPADHFSSDTLKFDSYRIRINSLTDIFQIYLKLCCTCNYTLANGSIGFIRCLTSYLKASSAFDQPKPKSKEDIESRMCDESEEDEDLFMSTNDSRIQERYHELTSNYEHLSKLASSTSNSNTLNKPFLDCLQTLFDLLMKQHSNLDKFPTQSVELDFKVEANPELDLISLQKKYKLEDYRCIRFESKEDFDRLNTFLDAHINLNETRNRFKLLYFFMSSLIANIYSTHDELNCVQMSESVFYFLRRLLECGKEDALVAYCLLDLMQMVLKTVQRMQNSLESCDSDKEPFLSAKLAQNKFFMASLLNKQINECLRVIIALNRNHKAETYEPVNIQLAVCCLSRMFYLIARSLQMKLEEFDALLDLTTIEMDLIISECFLNHSNREVVETCLRSIESINFLSFLPFRCLVDNYEHGGKSFEILTGKCRNAWQLFNVKKSFNLAKSLFSEDEAENRSKISLKSTNSESSKCELDLGKEDLNQMNEIEMDERDDNQFESNERNFYRDFTLRFYNAYSKIDDKNRLSENNSPSKDAKFKTIFAQLDQEESVFVDEQHVNLTSFLVIFKFQLNFIKALEKLITNHNAYSTFCTNKSGSLRLLAIFNETYLVTIKLDRVLAFKILLSKIFYLNQENSSTCFSCLTKPACLCILQCFFLFYLNISKNDAYSDWLLDFTCQEEMTNEGEMNKKLLNHLENVLLKNADNQELYFSAFFVHFWVYYFELNEQSHNFTFERIYLSNFYEKFKSIDVKELSNEEIVRLIEKELNDLFVLQKENNKALAMLNLSIKIESECDNTQHQSDITQHRKRLIRDLNSNESLYLLKDSRFRYQIWSNQISIPFLKDLNENLELFVQVFSKANLRSSKLFFKLLFQFVLVLNSCSNYCQCSTIVESKEYQHLLDISSHIVLGIIKQLFNQITV